MADIKITIDGNTFQLEKKVKDSIKTSQRSGQEAGDAYSKRFNQSVKNIAIGNIIADATRNAVRIFSREITQGVNSLRGLSRATQEVNSILGTNEKVTKEVSNQFREFSQQFGTGQQSQVKAFYGIVSGGIQGTTKRLEVLETANQAAVAGLVNIDTAATALVSSINAYSKAGLTATQASDQIFTAVRLGQTTFGELASTIGNVAPIASSLGISFDELAGSIAGVTTGGIATAQAVTGLRAVFNGIVKPTKEASDAAKELGVELGGDAIRNAGGLANFLEILIERTNGSSDALSRLFTSTEALTPILSIAERGIDGFRRTLEQTRDSGGSTALAFDDLSDSIDFEFAQIGAELESFRIELAQGLLPTFRELVPILKKDILPLLQGLAEAFATTATGALGLANIIKDIGQATSSFLNGDREQNLRETYVRLSSELKGIKDQLIEIEEIQEKGAANDEERLLVARRRQLVSLRNEIETQRFLTQQRLQELSSGELAGPPAPEQQAPIEQGSQEGEQAQTESGLLQQAFIGAALDQAKEKGQEIRSVYQGVGSVIAQSFTAAKGKTDEFNGSIKKLTDTVVQGLGQALTSSFSAFGAALANGEDALGAFGAAFLKQIGSISTQVGSFFILQGLGFQVLPGFQASGAALLAAGAGLVALGGFLSAVASPSSSASAVSSGSSNFGTDSERERDRFEMPDEEERIAQQQVQVVVQGDILDSEDTGRRLVDILEQNFRSDNSALTGLRTV